MILADTIESWIKLLETKLVSDKAPKTCVNCYVSHISFAVTGVPGARDKTRCT